MKLANLLPQYIATNPFRRGMGVSFKCPHCDQRVEIWFENPLDGGYADSGNLPLWKQTGETFQKLTLFPSIMINNHFYADLINGEFIDLALF